MLAMYEAIAKRLTKMSGVDIRISDDGDGEPNYYLEYGDMFGGTISKLITGSLVRNEPDSASRTRCSVIIDFADPDAFKKLSEAIKVCYKTGSCKDCKYKNEGIWND